MAFLSDIEIARQCKMLPAAAVAEKAGIDEKYLESYGRYKAKIDLSCLGDAIKEGKKDGKLVLVTAISPTPAGEGKTTTTIGLADGLSRIGKKVTVALREPSLGPVFGVKGGAAGWKMDYSPYLGGHYFYNLKALANFDKAYRTGSRYKELVLYLFEVGAFEEGLEKVAEVKGVPILIYDRSGGARGALGAPGKADPIVSLAPDRGSLLWQSGDCNLQI